MTGYKITKKELKGRIAILVLAIGGWMVTTDIKEILELALDKLVRRTYDGTANKVFNEIYFGVSK